MNEHGQSTRYVISLCAPRLLDQVRSPLRKRVNGGLQVRGANQWDRARIYDTDVFEPIDLKLGVYHAVKLSWQHYKTLRVRYREKDIVENELNDSDQSSMRLLIEVCRALTRPLTE